MQRTLEASREEGSWGLKRRDRTAQVTNSGQNWKCNAWKGGERRREGTTQSRPQEKESQSDAPLLGWKTDKAAVIPEGGEQGGGGQWKIWGKEEGGGVHRGENVRCSTREDEPANRGIA